MPFDFPQFSTASNKAEATSGLSIKSIQPKRMVFSFQISLPLLFMIPAILPAILLFS